MKQVRVDLDFQGRRYSIRGTIDQVNWGLRKVILDRISARVTQRAQAYKSVGKLHERLKITGEIERRLKFLRKQKPQALLEGLIKLMPLLKSLTPPVSSAHHASYRSFLNELNTWILKSYQDEVYS